MKVVKQRKVGCAYVIVWRGWKYSHIEVDLILCKDQGLETLGVAREIVRLLYDRVISRSEAWARALQNYPVAGRYVTSRLLEFIEAKSPRVPLYPFKGPRVWTVASPSHVVVVAERGLVEDAVAEVEKLLEHMPGSLRGGGSGGSEPG